MKKILLVVSIISALFLVGCDLNKNLENDNLSGDNEDYQHQEVIDNNQNAEDEQVSENEVNPIDSLDYYQKVMEARGGNYDAMIMPKNVFLNAKIYKLENEIVLKADVGNPYAFTIEEIRTIVENFENSNDKETKLGAYTIHKEYIEGFYSWYRCWFFNDISVEHDFVDDSFDKTKWYDEDKIPYYITDSYGGFIKLEYQDGFYYPYSYGVPVGQIAAVDDIKENAFELVLNEEDKVVLVYVGEFGDELYEEIYTVKELLDYESGPIEGCSYYNKDSFKIKDGAIYVYTDYYGGGN